MLLREHCAWRIGGARHATLSAPAPPRACRRCLVAVLAAPCRHVAISPLLCCVFMLRVYLDVASLFLSLSSPPTPHPPQWTTRNVHMYTHRRGRAKGACYSAEGEDRAAVCCRWARRASWHLHAACILRIPRCRPAAISLPTTCLVGSLVYEQFSL